jgi:septal ring factor EnvC (AmiA/AmiB activator)
MAASERSEDPRQTEAPREEGVGPEGAIESPQGELREEVETAEVVPPPSPARAPQPPYQRPAQQQRVRQDQQRYREQGSPIHKAIQDVEQIIHDLKETLEEMDEVLETLEQAEREKTADEREIEQLRRSLKGMHRGRDTAPPPRYNQGQRAPLSRSAPMPSRESEMPPNEPEPQEPSAADEPQPS